MASIATSATTTGPTSALVEQLRERLVRDDIRVPPFPAIAQRVITLASDDSASANAMAQLVQRDAALAAAVLRNANSAATGSVTAVVSLQQALARLGMARVVEIAVTTSLRTGPFASKTYADISRRIWRRSLTTALFAKEIAREVRKNVEIAFLCGLLWRVGQPIVLQALADEEPDSLEAQAVMLELGRDFSCRAVQSWDLPPRVGAAFAVDTPEELDCDEACFAAVGERMADLAIAGYGAPDSLIGDDAATRINLYPERIEALYAAAESILRDVDEMP